MLFWESILFNLLTTFIGATFLNYIGHKVNKHFELTSSQQEILNKKLFIYKDLYLNTVKNPYGININPNDADIYFRNFCNKFEKSDELLLFLSSKCICLLHEYNNKVIYKHNLRGTRYELKSQIERDFCSVKEKLGYSNELKIKKYVYINTIIFGLSVLWIICSIFMKTFYYETANIQIWNFIYLSCSITLVPLSLSFYYIVYNFSYVRDRRTNLRKNQ